MNKKDRKVKEDNLLVNQINATKKALDSAYAGFDTVTDPDLIDSYIYELNALSLRYKFLLQTAKDRHMEYDEAFMSPYIATRPF